VIPQTAAAFFAFVLFVLPGLTFERRRDRRWPQRGESPFREISGVVLASSAFSALALLILIAVRVRFPTLMPDPGAWLRDRAGDYPRGNYPVIVGFVFAQGALSTGLAMLVERLTARGREPTIRAISGWFEAFRMVVPPDTEPFVHVVLDTGVEYYGWVDGYTSDPSVDDRELELGRPLMRRLPDRNQPEPLPDHWKRLLISGPAIKTITVSYLPERPKPDRRSGKARLRQFWLRRKSEQLEEELAPDQKPVVPTSIATPPSTAQQSSSSRPRGGRAYALSASGGGTCPIPMTMYRPLLLLTRLSRFLVAGGVR
jgi:hypothetical protein